MNEGVARHPEELPIGALLRLAADGELGPEQMERLEAHLAAHPEDAARIEFERDLRKACARACCGCGCAPASLRERILAGAEPAATVGPEATRSRSYWLTGAIARYGALAAMVALVALVSFLAGRVGAPEQQAGVEIPSPTPRAVALSLASFARAEHERCEGGGPAIEGKFSIHDPGAVSEELSSIVGRAVTIPCILRAEREGLHFVDAGLCHPPTGDAMHIRFSTSGELRPPLVSLWVQPDDGRLAIEDGVTYVLGDGGECVRFWRLNGMRYVLVCPDAAAAPGVREALESPAPTRTF